MSWRRSIRTAADKPSTPAVAGNGNGLNAGAPLDIEELLRRVRPVSSSLASAFHGEDHWREVASIGLDLAQSIPGCDEIVVLLFAVLHDARRIGDDHDPPHGGRGAALVRSLGLGQFGLSETQLALAETACRDHTGGGLSADPTIGTCWDADRLTLRRVGIEPAARYMSTPTGRAAAASGQRFACVTDWSDLARRVRGPSPLARSPRQR